LHEQPPALSTSAAAEIPVVEIRSDKGLFHLDLPVLWRYRTLLYFLVWRELKVRYKQAAIGAGWAIVQPVMSVAIFTVVFGHFAKMPSDDVPYPVFAFAGMLPWTYFAEAMRRAATGLVSDAELIRKIYFPRLVIPLAMVVTPALDFAVSLLVLVPLAWWYGIPPTWHILFLPLFLVLAAMLAFAVGLWLGPINVRFRDVMQTLPLLIQVWMYASPIVYPVSIVPERWRLLYNLNPMVGVIEGCRWALLGKGTLDVQAIGISVVLVSVLLMAGIPHFKRMERSFADVI
jgi:lipopolysaccharide transport system permease protein